MSNIFDLLAKATSWNTNNAISPKVNKINSKTSQKFEGRLYKNLVAYFRNKPWKRSSFG